MNKFARLNPLAFLAATAIALSGCSSSSDESPTSTDVAPPAATKDDLAGMKKDAENQAAKLKSEVAAALAKQREAFQSQISANTSNLTSQMDGLKSKYESLKGALPEEVLKVVKEQIPDLETSVKKLKDLVAKFDPKTLEELESFKTKYQKEYEIAQKLMSEASKLLEKSGMKIPKPF